MKEQCKKLENDDNKFSQYIHEYWLPWLDEQRKAGKLIKGKYQSQILLTITDEKRIEITIKEYDYTGEMDQDGKACGQGVAVFVNDKDMRYEGTFLDDQPHGLCR